MKETIKSLGGYLMFIGVIGVIGCLVYFLNPPSSFDTSWMLGAVFSAWSALALYIGAKLKTLLVKNPQLPFRYCIGSIILSLSTMNIIQIFLGVLFNGYVIHQLRRLAREEPDVLEAQVLS